MTKTPLLLLSLLACNNGKITAGDSNYDVSESENNLPVEADEDEEPQAQPEQDIDTPEDDVSVGSEDDTGSAPTDGGDGVEDDREVTLEDYLSTYCESYAVPCMGYPSVENCVEAMLIAHFTGCSVTNEDALAECDAWVATIDCAETSWNPACDAFITCD